MIFLALFLALGLTNLVRSTAWFQGNFNYTGVGFFAGYAAVFVLDILMDLAALAALWLMKRDRKAFFFVKGQMDAPVERVRCLGIKWGESWKVIGWFFAGGCAG